MATQKISWLIICLPKEWDYLGTIWWKILRSLYFICTVSVLVWVRTIHLAFLWVLSLRAAVQTWHWHQADNICKGYSVKTRKGKSLKSLARSLYHGPWCLHRTYLRKLRQLGMFVQLQASSIHTYIQYIQHTTYSKVHAYIYTVHTYRIYNVCAHTVHTSVHTLHSVCTAQCMYACSSVHTPVHTYSTVEHSRYI